MLQRLAADFPITSNLLIVELKSGLLEPYFCRVVFWRRNNIAVALICGKYFIRAPFWIEMLTSDCHNFAECSGPISKLSFEGHISTMSFKQIDISLNSYCLY